MNKNNASTNTFLAVFLGTSQKMQEWSSRPEAEQKAKMKEGMDAWKAWVEKYQGSIIEMGGPLGKTKKVSPKGIEDVSNALCAFTVVRANSQEEAAKMFEKHPHFTIFPGDGVEVMPILPIPTADGCSEAA